MSNLEIDLVVTAASALTKAITHFSLLRAHASPLPAFSAGAHILVGPGPGMVRTCSPCGDPVDTTHYEIAVKREEVALLSQRLCISGSRPGAPRCH